MGKRTLQRRVEAAERRAETRGRDTLLTPAIQAAIAKDVAEGTPFTIGCELHGIKDSTGSERLKRERGEHPSRPATPEFVAA